MPILGKTLLMFDIAAVIVMVTADRLSYTASEEGNRKLILKRVMYTGLVFVAIFNSAFLIWVMYVDAHGQEDTGSQFLRIGCFFILPDIRTTREPD